MIEISEIETQETELTDAQLENITGGLCTNPGGGGVFGLGGFYGGGFGFGSSLGGFYGGPVLIAQPQVTLVPVVQTTQVVVDPVPVTGITGVTGVQTTNCHQSVALALV